MLTDSTIKAAKAKDKNYKLTDERGMYLLVHTNGGKYFRLDYKMHGKRKTIALGVYPDVTLKQAREKRESIRSNIANGIDPLLSLHKSTFSELFQEWQSININWSDKYRKDVIDRARINILPIIGDMDMDKITHDHLIAIINRMKIKGLHSKSCHKMLAYISAVYRLAIAKRICDRNIAEDVKPLLPTGTPVKPRACISEYELPDFVQNIHGYTGKFETKIALKLLLWTATRPQETYAARWVEFDLDSGLWTIPVERMKLRRVHVVPLQKGIIEDLRLLKQVSGHLEYLFPNQQHPRRHMSENTLNIAIKKHLGFDSTAHGLRATFSTVMNNLNYRPDIVDSCLAHLVKGVESRYNRSDYMRERRKIMQDWEDYLLTFIKSL
jgi:integrase